MKKNGYTLMELLVVITVLVGLMVGGTSLFLSNLRSGGMNEAILKTSRSARTIADLIESRLRFARVWEVGGQDRDACQAAGDTGVIGSSILFENVNGTTESIIFKDGMIASASADEVTLAVLNGTGITVKSLDFEWFCRGGINDKIKMTISLTGSEIGLRSEVSESIFREINLLNSGAR